MQKKNKRRKSFKSMTISSKITLIYSGFFSFIFIIFSAFLILNAHFMYSKMSENELSETLGKIEEYIKSGEEITREKINELNPNKYVEIAVFKTKPDAEPFPKAAPEAKPDAAPSEKKENILPRDGFSEEETFSDVPPEPKDRELSEPSAEGNGNISDFREPPFERNRSDRMRSETIRGERYFYFNRNVTVDGVEYTIQVFRPYNREQNIINFFVVIFLVANAVGVAISYLLGKLISRRILKPVTAVTNAAKSITINDLSKRIEVPEADDEIRTLAVTFNEMIERLDKAVEKQRRFVSDASHELRTPISVLKGYADLLNRWGKDDPEVLRESIDSIKAETEQMSSLVDGLLQLAREDNGNEITKEKINISDIANDIRKEYELSFPNVDFKFNIENNIFINGNDVLIKQLFMIFAENAVKYNKSEKVKIDISLTRKKDKAYLSVSDNGIGISDEDIPLIFDRFYRGDKSRNKEINGTGLGLSIADAIIKKHSGSVKTKSEIGRGTTFTVCLPVYADKTDGKQPQL